MLDFKILSVKGNGGTITYHCSYKPNIELELTLHSTKCPTFLEGLIDELKKYNIPIVDIIAEYYFYHYHNPAHIYNNDIVHHYRITTTYAKYNQCILRRINKKINNDKILF